MSVPDAMRGMFRAILLKINGMDWLYSLFVGGGIAHTVFTLALVITAGILLGKVKVCGISLGITWILFVGIIAAHFGMGIPAEVRHFIQEFGLILFCFFQFGYAGRPGVSFRFVQAWRADARLPGFDDRFARGRRGVRDSFGIGYADSHDGRHPFGCGDQHAGTGCSTAGLCGRFGSRRPQYCPGYAVAYPLGVIGIIFSMIFIRYALRVKFGKEDEALAAISAEHKMAEIVSIECTNKRLSSRADGLRLSSLKQKDGELAPFSITPEQWGNSFVLFSTNGY